MSDRFDRLHEQRGDSPEEMATRAFSRCQNWPKDRMGIAGLVEALERAAERFGVQISRIISECAQASVFCPTDADILNVARALKPADPIRESNPCPLSICDGSGWMQIHHMHTHHQKPGGGTWIERQTITRGEFDDLCRKIDWKTQMVYESRHRCTCHPPLPDEIEKRGKYA